MTDKELRHLSRKELLEILLALAEENDALREQLEYANDALRDRRILLENTGSIAEAALKLNGVFAAAEAAAQQYLANVQLKEQEERKAKHHELTENQP